MYINSVRYLHLLFIYVHIIIYLYTYKKFLHKNFRPKEKNYMIDS